MNTFQAILKQEYLINKRSISNLIMAIDMPVAFFLLFTTIWANDESMPADVAKVWIRLVYDADDCLFQSQLRLLLPALCLPRRSKRQSPADHSAQSHPYLAILCQQNR